MAGSLGLQGAYASGSLQALLRQRMQDQIDAELRARQAMESDRRFGLDQQAHTSTEQLKRATLDATIANRDAQRGDQQFRMDQGLAEQIPANAELPGSSPVLGQLQRIGMVSAKGIQEQPPPASIAANPDETPTDLPGTVANSPLTPTNPGRLYRKLPTSKQTEYATTEADRNSKDAETARVRESDIARQTARDTATVTRETARDAETQRHNKAVENKPVTPGTITIQTVDDQGNPVTRIVPKTAGSEFKKPPSAVTANRLDSAAAVEQTGNDIIARLSDPAFQKVVGPAMGRASTLQDFIGNPPPEFSELAGQIESYALANMGVHGMRSAQGAEQIKHLLTQHHTPESLIAAVKGLNGFSRHFMENAGRERDPRTTAGPAPAPVEEWTRGPDGKLVRKAKP